MDDEREVRTALDEVDTIVDSLVKENNLAGALEVSMRGLEIRKSYFGVGSIDFETARVGVARMVLQAADAHHVHKQYKEAVELLGHVDKLTLHPLPKFPALNRNRLVVRVAMYRDMLTARFQQGRHRSALSFGRRLLDIAKSLHLLHVIPTIYLNMASVYSGMKLHSDALAHCYVAYQHTCRILGGLESQDPYVLKALEVEETDKALDFVRSYDTFEEALRLSDPDVTFEAVPTMELALPQFNIEVDEDEERSISYMQYALWAATTKKQDASRFPCVSLVSELHAETVPKPSRSNLSAAQKRWGGFLALVFRSIAVEQEHLNEIQSALLTYKVAHTTAVQCLGEEHPVAQQCGSAMRDAENTSEQRETQKSYFKLKLSDTMRRSRARTSASIQGRLGNTSPTPGTRPSTKSGTRSRPVSQMQSLSRVERPGWNEWFNSSAPPPSHQLRRSAKPMTAPARRHTGLDETLETMPSAIGLTDEDLAPHLQVSTSAAERSTELPPPTRAATSHSHRRPMTLSPITNPPTRTKPKRDATERPMPDEDVEPIDPADYAFLAQTFGLSYDREFSRLPRSKLNGSQRSRSEERQDRQNSDRRPDVEAEALRQEKNLVRALAAEMGVKTEL